MHRDAMQCNVLSVFRQNLNPTLFIHSPSTGVLQMQTVRYAHVAEIPSASLVHPIIGGIMVR